jgi:hypothetical protein
VGLECYWVGGMKKVYIILEGNLLQTRWLRRLTRRLQATIKNVPTSNWISELVMGVIDPTGMQCLRLFLGVRYVLGN